VLPPTAHEGVLFFWCPHLQERNKAQIKHIINTDMALAKIVFSRDKSGVIAVIQTSISFYLCD
jgi:hypothetical protein